MTNRNLHRRSVWQSETLTYCPGSHQRPLSVWRDVGICRGCGVRTHTHNELIPEHGSTRADREEFLRRGHRAADRMPLPPRLRQQA